MIKLLFLLFILSQAIAADHLCSKISDDFCEELWRLPNLGNLKTSVGTFAAGKSSKSSLSMVQIKNVQSFLANVHRFPPELSKNPKYMAVARKIKEHLRKEDSSKLWRSKLDFIYSELTMVFELIVYDLFIKQNPQLKRVKEESYMPDDWQKLVKIKENLRTKMIDAKLKDSVEWKLVDKTFQHVREKMLSVIDETSLPLATKEKMKNQLLEVTLSLPYTDPDLLGVDYSCSQDTTQATYYYFRKKITMCAGYFYGFQSEATLSSVMAHELGHAIDLNQMSIDAFRETPSGQKQIELLKLEGPIRSCKVWNEFKAQGVWSETRPKISNHEGQFDKFKMCLRGKAELKPLTSEALTDATQYINGNDISGLAKNYNFSFLATTEIYREGKLIPNPFYLRPDLKLWSNSNYSTQYRLTDSAPIQHFFVYNLICEEDKEEPRDLQKLSVEEKNALFAAAIVKTKKMALAHITSLFETCGDECSGLVNFSLSKPTAENFADWVSTKVMTKIIEQLEASKRFSFAREVGAVLCEKPEYHFDHELMIQEKKFSRETHGNNRVRRWSMISPEVAKLLECSVDKKQSLDFAECKL